MARDEGFAGLGAVVTGASSEIGQAIAGRLAAAGAMVACLDVQEPAVATEPPGAADGELRAFVCDVTDPDAVARTIGEVRAWAGRIDILVHGAAVFDRSVRLPEQAFEEWQEIVRVILDGAFLTAKHVIPHMVEAGGGAIVNIASQLGHVAAPGRAAYCAAKGGLIQFTRALAVENAVDRIRANTVSPGATATSRMVRRFGDLETAQREAAKTHPLGRLATPDEVADAVLFLAGPRARFVTGTDLLVDGGYCAV